MIRVLVWNEFHHEKTSDRVRAIYPDGIHRVIADFLQCEDITVKTATFEDENCGITKEVLDETDVLIWWGHVRHKMVPDEVVDLVQAAVLSGMGASIFLIWLYSTSTSVTRPNIFVAIFAFFAESLSSLIVPKNPFNGPSSTETVSPIANAPANSRSSKRIL